MLVDEGNWVTIGNVDVGCAGSVLVDELVDWADKRVSVAWKKGTGLVCVTGIFGRGLKQAVNNKLPTKASNIYFLALLNKFITPRLPMYQLSHKIAFFRNSVKIQEAGNTIHV
jgi:hypothetical protein